MDKLMKWINRLDKTIETIGAVMMIFMVAIVFLQVIARYVLHHIPAWTEEMALLLMMWYGFLSIGLGFRYKAHLQITMIVEKFPKPIQVVVDIIVQLLIIAFGILLIVEGYKFTMLTWDSTLPVTKMPAGMQYIIIPFTGVLTMIYGFLWLINRKENVN